MLKNEWYKRPGYRWALNVYWLLYWLILILQIDDNYPKKDTGEWLELTVIDIDDYLNIPKNEKQRHGFVKMKSNWTNERFQHSEIHFQIYRNFQSIFRNSTFKQFLNQSLWWISNKEKIPIYLLALAYHWNIYLHIRIAFEIADASPYYWSIAEVRPHTAAYHSCIRTFVQSIFKS